MPPATRWRCRRNCRPFSPESCSPPGPGPRQRLHLGELPGGTGPPLHQGLPQRRVALPDEIGQGLGEGATINIGLPAGCGDADYLHALDRVVAPAGFFVREGPVSGISFVGGANSGLAAVSGTGVGIGALVVGIITLSDVKAVINEAGSKFNLSPADMEYLARADEIK